MTGIRQGLYLGDVIHRRIRPKRHRLRYTVFSVLFDVDDLARTSKKSRLFSHNRFNLLSFYDRDHGDGGPVRAHIETLARQAGIQIELSRILVLCYPRILGYAFNPLTVYYCLDESGEIVLTVYEVNNTFGERTSYVLPVQAGQDVIAQSCRKRMYVSPFNDVSGSYGFRLTRPDASALVGVSYRDADGPVLTAQFRGTRRDFTDREILKAIGRTGWMTAKVMVGIHVEALKLWLKGLSLKPRDPAPSEAKPSTPMVTD